MASNLNLSNTSFTNKEFNDIYPELLEKARDLSYKWDPTVSNESDPGVTLIKEIALALDKINYSADKNALETMPLSVTQERTARQLFQLLGYYPKWYISAEAEVSLAWKIEQGDTGYVSNGVVKIPAFTSIRDDSGDYVYTIPVDTPLHSDGSVSNVAAIQGVLKPLKINNSSLITLDLLDANNRVYFPDYNVAQNGIFVLSKDAQESKQINARSFWEQKDNLYIEEVGNYYYSFNVDISTNRCYLEFPADISDLIGGGLYVYYLISAGKDGLVGIGQLNQLYDSSINAEYIEGGTGTVTLNSENLRIQNIDLYVSGQDPESISSMYTNYNHVKGTFDTLVTLRDYNNAVYNTGLVSNAVVCDRTNDIQESYRIVASALNETENVVYTQEASKTANGMLEPFGLKIYALQYNDLTNTTSTTQNRQAYDNTFQLYTDLDAEDPLNIDSSLRQLVMVLNDDRCVQHNFRDIEPNKMCLLKNVAEVRLVVFPTIKLTDLQKQDVTNAIRNQIYNMYNARKVNFGEEINYDDLYTNILTSSNLIKNISLNQIKYYTYALYYSVGELDGKKKLASEWKQVCVSNEVDYVMIRLTSKTTKSDGRVVHAANLYGAGTDVLSLGKKNIYLMVPDDQESTGGGNVYFLNRDGEVVLYSTKRKQFREEILVKNILAGVTPLFQTDKNGFIYGADETDTQFESAQKLDITAIMPFEFNNQTQARYYPKTNEVIQFVKPQLSSAITYGSYVKYDYIGRSVSANMDHRLANDETLILYYKTEDNEAAPYTKVVYGATTSKAGFEPAIICPTFNLEQTTRSFPTMFDQTQTPSSALTIKSGQQIDIKQKNQVVLNNTTNYIYVIGNEFVNSDNVSYYRLELTRRSANPTSAGYYYYTATLQNEQQLIYASDQLSYMNIVGSGTKITIQTKNGDDSKMYIENPVVSVRSIQRYGVSALNGKWKKISDKITLLAQEFVNVIGTADDTPVSNTDAYVEIISPVAIGQTVNLKRGGLSYASSSGAPSMQGGVAAGNVVYVDSSGNSKIENVTPLPDVVSEFVTASKYYKQPTTDSSGKSVSFIDTIELQPAPYKTEQVDTYKNGLPVSLVGRTSYDWTLGNASAHYLISGSSLYLITTEGEDTQAIPITGYPSSLGTAIAFDLDAETSTSTRWVYTAHDTSKKLEPGKTLILINPSAPLKDQVYGGTYLMTNNTGETQDISFTTSEDVSAYSLYKVSSYYRITSILFDYNTSDPQADQYMTPVGAPVPAISSNVGSSGRPNQYITIQAQEIVTQRRITFALTQAQNTYEYQNSADARTYAIRYWVFTDYNKDTVYIADANVRTKVLDYPSITFPGRTLNQWVWPITDFSITIVAAKDAGSLDPSLYQFKYKNKGGDVETLYLSSEEDSGWSVYGLAYIDSSTTEPTKVFPNQTLKINGKSVSTGSEDSSAYVYSSIPLYIEGYSAQNLKYIDDSGNEDYPRILVTEVDKNPSGYSETFETKTILIDKEVGIDGGDDGWSDLLKLAYIPPTSGYYIFSLKNYFELEKFYFTLTFKDLEVKCLNATPVKKTTNSLGRRNQNYDLKAKGVYYFMIYPTKMDSTDDLEIGFYFGITAKDKTDSVTGLTDDEYELLAGKNSVKVEVSSIKPLGYSDDAYITTSTVLDWVPKVQKLAQYNGRDVFNYFYQPQEDKLILNPLESTSFNNHNHFYNPYTICNIHTYDILGDSNILINT